MRAPSPRVRGEVKWKSVLATHQRPSYANATAKSLAPSLTFV
jgi:hypothetical protein